MPSHRPRSGKEAWPRKCLIKFCRKRIPKRERNLICSKHRARRFKERYPLKYHYNKLKYRARERGHTFTLTFGRYEQICIEAGWVTEHRGKTAACFSINRIKDHLGYTDDNVEVLTLSENCRLRYATHVNGHSHGLSESDKEEAPF